MREHNCECLKRWNWNEVCLCKHLYCDILCDMQEWQYITIVIAQEIHNNNWSENTAICRHPYCSMSRNMQGGGMSLHMGSELEQYTRAARHDYTWMIWSELKQIELRAPQSADIHIAAHPPCNMQEQPDVTIHATMVRTELNWPELNWECPNLQTPVLQHTLQYCMWVYRGNTGLSVTFGFQRNSETVPGLRVTVA